MASGVLPIGCIQTWSPVLMSIAVMRPYGGLTNGRPNTVIGGSVGVLAAGASPPPRRPPAPRPASPAGPAPSPPPPPPPRLDFPFDRDGASTRLGLVSARVGPHCTAPGFAVHPPPPPLSPPV